jgi:hypothetical protein
MQAYVNLDENIFNSNSCSVEVVKNNRGGIRIKIDENLIQILVRPANGETSFKPCHS